MHRYSVPLYFVSQTPTTERKQSTIINNKSLSLIAKTPVIKFDMREEDMLTSETPVATKHTALPSDIIGQRLVLGEDDSKVRF